MAWKTPTHSKSAFIRVHRRLKSGHHSDTLGHNLVFRGLPNQPSRSSHLRVGENFGHIRTRSHFYPRASASIRGSKIGHTPCTFGHATKVFFVSLLTFCSKNRTHSVHTQTR